MLRDGPEGPHPTPKLQPYERAAQNLRLHVREAHYHVWKCARPLLSLPSFLLEHCITTISARSVQPKQTQIPGADSRESSCTKLAAHILRDPLFAVIPVGHVRRRLSRLRPCAPEPGSHWHINPSAGVAVPQLEMQIQLLQHQTPHSLLPPQLQPPMASMEILVLVTQGNFKHQSVVSSPNQNITSSTFYPNVLCNGQDTSASCPKDKSISGYLWHKSHPQTFGQTSHCPSFLQ